MAATVTVTAPALRKAARWARPDPKAPLPVLHHVRVAVTAGQVVLAVYDWETCLLARIPGDTHPLSKTTESVLVPAAQLDAAVASLPAVRAGKIPDVEVTVHGGDSVDLVAFPGTATAHRVTVGQTVEAAAYPKMPAMPAIAGWADGTVFAPAAELAAGCCSGEDELPLIQAVHFYPGRGPNRGVLGVEGTNRYVMALHQIPFTPDGSPGEALVPARLVARFIKAGLDGPVFLGALPGKTDPVMLADGWHAVVTRPPAGDYPKLATRAARIPEAAAEITVDVADLRSAADAAAETLAAARKAHAETLLADTSDGRPDKDKRAAVRAKAGQGMFVEVAGGGDQPCTVEVFAVHPFTGAELGRWPLGGAVAGGTPVVVSLNPAYLAAVLPAAGKVTVAFAGAFQPVRVAVAGSPYTGIVSPIQATPPVRDDKEDAPE